MAGTSRVDAARPLRSHTCACAHVMVDVTHLRCHHPHMMTPHIAPSVGFPNPHCCTAHCPIVHCSIVQGTPFHKANPTSHTALGGCFGTRPWPVQCHAHDSSQVCMRDSTPWCNHESTQVPKLLMQSHTPWVKGLVNHYYRSQYEAEHNKSCRVDVCAPKRES